MPEKARAARRAGSALNYERSRDCEGRIVTLKVHRKAARLHLVNDLALYAALHHERHLEEGSKTSRILTTACRSLASRLVDAHNADVEQKWPRGKTPIRFR